jgi:LysR family transcriptional regulator for bpeEF and oprC
VAVVEAGSFSKAADVLESHPPAVSNGIKALELTLGVRLINRTTRRISLTHHGEVFYEQAQALLQHVAQAKSLFQPARNDASVRGKLRIDIPSALAAPLVIPRLKEFSARYPAIELVVGVSDMPVDLIAEGVDCVIRVGELPSSSMVGRRLAMAPMVTCGSPSYLAQYGTPHTLDDLSKHKAVSYFFGSSRRIMNWQFITAEGVKEIKVKSGMLVNDSAAFVQSALSGFGLVQVLRIGVQQHLDDGTLVQVLPDFPSPSRQISLLYPEKRLIGQPLGCFLEWVPSLFSSVTA